MSYFLKILKHLFHIVNLFTLLKMIESLLSGIGNKTAKRLIGLERF